MNQPLNVNEALDRLDELSGADIRIKGILSFEFENMSISHTPKSERRDGYNSLIWLEVGCGALGFDERVCERLNGKLFWSKVR